MKHYLLSLATGVLVGVIYALLRVRSPAPPAIALIGPQLADGRKAVIARLPVVYIAEVHQGVAP